MHAFVSACEISPRGLDEPVRFSEEMCLPLAEDDKHVETESYCPACLSTQQIKEKGEVPQQTSNAEQKILL